MTPPASSPEEKAVNGKLEELRQQARTQFMRDPLKLAALKQRAKQSARKVLVDAEVIEEGATDSGLRAAVEIARKNGKSDKHKREKGEG